MFDLEKLKDNNAIFWIFKYPEYRSLRFWNRIINIKRLWN